MNSVENLENLAENIAKTFYNAGEIAKNFAEAVSKAAKATNRPDCTKIYSECKRKKKVAKHG